MNNFKLKLASSMIRSKSLTSLEILDNVSDGLKVFHDCVFQNKNGTDRSHPFDIEVDWEESSVEERAFHVREDVNTSTQISTHAFESIYVLEKKIEKLNDLLLEQQKLLTGIKMDLNNPFLDFKNVSVVDNKSHFDDKTLAEDFTIKEVIRSTLMELIPINADGTENDRAKSLLDAIELKHAHFVEQEIKNALTKFLQNDALKERIVSATEQCVKDVIRSCFSQNFSALYLPILEQSQRRLLKHVTKTLEDSFKELEENLSIFSNSAHKTTRTLRKALERHQSLIEDADYSRNLIRNLQRSLQEILQTELKEWRENLCRLLFTKEQDDISEDDLSNSTSANYSPVSPPQPADPERSIIDQLMKSAEVNKQIKDGNVNGSFEKALSSSDLSLVMAACRAADPVKIFSPPCKLRQSVLLSLIQQLATDMVHDTQLKCRYLEDAIINLNTLDSVTRSYLPVVVADVRKHLKKFLLSYPSHVACRRVALIIMAADNLLK